VAEGRTGAPGGRVGCAAARTACSVGSQTSGGAALVRAGVQVRGRMLRQSVPVDPL
jgi:hypothetical protein